MKIKPISLNVSGRSQVVEIPGDYQFLSLKLIGHAPFLFVAHYGGSEIASVQIHTLECGVEFSEKMELVFLDTLVIDGLARHYFLQEKTL